MGDTAGPSPPPPPTSQKLNLHMLYYSLVVVGTAAVLLAIYNLIIICWCKHRQDDSRQRPARLTEITASQSFENQSSNLLSSFKYKKESSNMGSQDPRGEYECAVCLSVFEDGEEVRQLPSCKHSFHAPCIDMWLYSHTDCPLCRAAVDPSLLCHRQTVVNSAEYSRESLLDTGSPA